MDIKDKLGIHDTKPKAQSVDFNEIWSTQSDMDVSDDEFDWTFHNWHNPEKCSQNRVYKTCFVCDQLKKDNYPGYVLGPKGEKVYTNKDGRKIKDPGHSQGSTEEQAT